MVTTATGQVLPTSDRAAAQLFDEFMTNPFRLYTDSASQLISILGAGSNLSVLRPHCDVNPGTGIDKAICRGENWPNVMQRAAPGGSDLPWEHGFKVACWVALKNVVLPTRTQFVGLGYGLPDGQGQYPWQNFQTPAAVSIDSFVQLRIRCDTLKHELVSYSGDLVNMDFVVELTGVEPPQVADPPIGQLLTIHYEPQGPFLRAYVNGQLGAEITDPVMLPAPGRGNQFSFPGANWFITSGTNAAGRPFAFMGPLFVQQYGPRLVVLP